MKVECTECHITLNEEEVKGKYNNKCPMCNQINTYVPKYIMDIKRISTDESFIQAMIKLYNEDPIEYQLKLNQFKLQQEQKDEIFEKQRQENQVHCPYCDSTNVSKITGTERAISVIGLGIFSKKINKSFKCKKCGGTF